MSNNEDSFDTSVLDLSLPAAAAALSPQDRADLFNALKSKLLDFAGQHSDMLKYLSPIVRKRVDVLREIQGQHDKLKANFFEEKAALEAKYQKLYEPFYTKRYEIVNGVVEATDEAVTEQGGDKATKEKGVPNFWLNAMKTNEVLEEQITERDEGALKFLKDIKWCKIDNPKGFKLEFLFDSNPYFKNSVLTKTYNVITEDVEPILYKAIGTEIDWYPGKSLTHIILKKKLRKGSKNTKPITNTENCDSFFNFFNPSEIPEDDDNIDEDFADEHWNRLEQDYAVGATIRDKIIPHAVSWFTGEALISQGVGSVEENDDNDDEDDEEEDDDDEDEEEKYKGNFHLKSVGASPVEIQQGERPWECKQQ